MKIIQSYFGESQLRFSGKDYFPVDYFMNLVIFNIVALH